MPQMPPPVITFLSDYGLVDDFVGVCHAVIATLCPDCRIIDLSGQVTQYGHVGIDPDPARDAYYTKLYGQRQRFFGTASIDASVEVPFV